MIGNRKGQAAMEYLMTYGWALLVIVIVIAVLMWINPFKAPEQCIFDQAGFVCAKPVLMSGTGAFYTTITNGNQKTVLIKGIAVVKGRGAPPSDPNLWNVLYTTPSTVNLRTNPIKVPYQEQFSIGTDTGFVNVRSTQNATAPSVYTPAKGEDFNGRLYIAYTFDDDNPNVPAKIVGANLVTKAQ